MIETLTTRQIAVRIGRTDSRVRQLIRGETTIEPLPAEFDGNGGRGRYVTSSASFGAWLGAWVVYRGPWQQDRIVVGIGN